MHGVCEQHHMVLSFSDLSSWCYACDVYVHNPVSRPFRLCHAQGWHKRTKRQMIGHGIHSYLPIWHSAPKLSPFLNGGIRIKLFLYMHILSVSLSFYQTTQTASASQWWLKKGMKGWGEKLWLRFCLIHYCKQYLWSLIFLVLLSSSSMRNFHCPRHLICWIEDSPYSSELVLWQKGCVIWLSNFRFCLRPRELPTWTSLVKSCQVKRESHFSCHRHCLCPPLAWFHCQSCAVLAWPRAASVYT